MSESLLNKTRKIIKLINYPEEEPVSFAQLCTLLSEVLASNIYIISIDGTVPGFYFSNEKDSSIIYDEQTGENLFPDSYTREINKIDQTMINLTQDSLLSVFKNEFDNYDKYASVVPIIGGGVRLGSLVLSRYDEAFTWEDIILSEFSASVVGLEMVRKQNEKNKQFERAIEVVNIAMSTLSYSEQAAMKLVFDALEGTEGLLITSKIADNAGMTRSVIVNGLRKLESAGLIEARSLGMKGTYLKVINSHLLPKLKQM